MLKSEIALTQYWTALLIIFLFVLPTLKKACILINKGSSLSLSNIENKFWIWLELLIETMKELSPSENPFTQ